MRMLVRLLVALLALSMLGLQAPASAADPGIPPPVRNPQCKANLSAADTQRLAQLSDTRTVTTFPIALQRIHDIRDVLVANRDNRGLFPVIYYEIMARAANAEAVGVQDPSFTDELGRQFMLIFLENLHGNITGGPVTPQWKTYFDMAADCRRTIGRVAAAALDTHLVFDFGTAINRAGATPAKYWDFMRIGDDLVNAVPTIVANLKAGYGADLGPVLHLFWVGDVFDFFTFKGMTTGLLFQIVRYSGWLDAMMLSDPGQVWAAHFFMQLKWQLAYGLLDQMERGGLI